MNDLEVIAALAGDLTISMILLWLLVSERKRADDIARRYENRHDRLVDWTLHNAATKFDELDRHRTRPITRPEVDPDKYLSE